jgi:hypothetical protein
MRKRNWLGLLTLIALLVIALPGCMPGGEEANAQSAAINDVRAKADSNAGQISGLTGRVGALEARAVGEVSAASFAALQAQVNGLQTTIGAQEARIAELEAADTDNVTGGTGTSAGDIVAETRWRLRPDFTVTRLFNDDTDFEITSDDWGDWLSIGVASIEPRTIKTADVYEVKIRAINLSTTNAIKLDNAVFKLLFEPSDDVKVSDGCDIYQIAGPYNIYWNTDVKVSSSTGICRYIVSETDEFDLRIPKNTTVAIDLEFELIYS